MRPSGYYNWHAFLDDVRPEPVGDPHRRVRICLVVFFALLSVVFGRIIQLEVTQGAAFREQAARPLQREHLVPGVRGRILAANGTVLAGERETRALAVHYRWIEEPADPGWLRWMARQRLGRAERRDPQRMAEAEAEVLAERQALAERIVGLTGIPFAQWRTRAARVVAGVEHVRDSVNRRRREAFEMGEARPARPTEGLISRAHAWLAELLAGLSEPRGFLPIQIAEELEYHVMIEDVPVEVVAEIEGQPNLYPAVQLVARRQRTYPYGTLAAHALGHLGKVQAEELSEAGTDYHGAEWVGRMGLERAHEAALRARPGVAVELTDRSGRVFSTYRRNEPTVGRDLLLTLDPDLQRTAESLLEQAVARRNLRLPEADPTGGAVVVLNVHTGAVLAAASAPGYDPNLFVAGDAAAVERLLRSPGDPLFDRTIRMAIAPGSVFKIVTAAALLENAAIRPGESFHCRGYLRSPDHLRCAVYRHRGSGHGDVVLSDALCASCNVYFFHHAGRLGWAPIADWAWRFGLGQPTGIDIPREAAGRLPMPRPIPEDGIDRWAELASVGQGSVAATPIQIARLMAAVANGGKLVAPHLVRGYGLEADEYSATPPAEAGGPEGAPHLGKLRGVEGLTPATLAAIREGLRRTVADPLGTAYGGEASASIAWAGKTGTAETGFEDQEHAWMAGYAPADRPKVALVVVIERAGNASDAAVPVARRLVARLEELGRL